MTVTNPYYRAAELCEQGWIRGHETETLANGHTSYCAMGAIRASTIEQLDEGMDISKTFLGSRLPYWFKYEDDPDFVQTYLSDAYITYGDRWVKNHGKEFGGLSVMYAYNDSYISSQRKIALMLRRIGYAWELEYGEGREMPLTTRSQKLWRWLDMALSGLPKNPEWLPIIEPPALREERLLAEEVQALQDEQLLMESVEITPQVLDLFFTEKMLVSS